MKITFTLSFLLFTIFHSLAQGLPLPYYTGFDNAQEQAGWNQFRHGDEVNYEWSVGGGGFSNPNCLSHDYNVGGGPDEVVVDWYVSPAIDISNAAHLSLKVKSSGFSTPTVDNCEVYYGIGNQDPGDGFFTLLTNISVATPQFEWIDFAADIPATGDEVYIAIKYKTIGAAWMTYSIDDINLESVTGVDETPALVSAENSISVFPNPAKDFLRVSLPSSSTCDKLEIYNLFGQVICSFSNLKNSTLVIETSSLEGGVYFIRHLDADKKEVTRKFIIQK